MALAGPLLLLGALTGTLSLSAAFIAGLFTVLTAGLLVWDLKRPDRFWRVIAAPNLRSWLPWGAYILTAVGVVCALWFLASLAGQAGLVRLLVWPAVLLGIGSAGYSAFLFGQAEGRDFWQSPLLLWQLLGAAALAGASTLLLLQFALEPTNERAGFALGVVLLAGTVVTCAIALCELYAPHAHKDVSAAATYMRRGPRASAFWWGYIGTGVILPVIVLAAVFAGVVPVALTALAGVLALVGLWFYEDAWVRAGQSAAMS
jgi:formate-dependent nitrite reductase membrane component NrfD